MKMSISSTYGLAYGTTTSYVTFTVIRCHGLATHGSTTMRDFHVSWDVRWAHVLRCWCAVVLGL